ncbi:MAG: Uma2 family endonuclease [Chloroflexota bacterium]|nr:Uma2 family endonuclease [Chloroflexota bacterium]
MAVERLGGLPRPHQFTVEEYLAFEERSEFKHEFIDGVIYDWGDPHPKAPVHPDFVPGRPMPHLFTVAEYLAFEAESEFKHEFIDGIIYDMTGGAFHHSRIKVNITVEFDNQLRDSDYAVCNSDMSVRVGESRYVYPDLSVVRGQPQLEYNDTTLLNPVLAVEVTSPASFDYDRVKKRSFYSAIASLQAYLVIDQHRVHVELYTRREDGWLWQTFDSMEDIARLQDLGCELALAAIYRSISFP